MSKALVVKIGSAPEFVDKTPEEIAEDARLQQVFEQQRAERCAQKRCLFHQLARVTGLSKDEVRRQLEEMVAEQPQAKK